MFKAEDENYRKTLGKLLELIIYLIIDESPYLNSTAFLKITSEKNNSNQGISNYDNYKSKNKEN